MQRDARKQTDDALLEACRDGDGTAFDELVRRNQDRIYNLACRMLGSREDALDLTQEVFVRAYGAIHGFRGASQVSTWMYRIAVNLARNRLRDRGRKGRNMGESLDQLRESAPAMAEQATASPVTPRDTAERAELAEALQQCLNELPETYRTVFVLRTVDELRYDEIAEVLDIPSGTVKSRLNQARRLLHAQLAARGLLE